MKNKIIFIGIIILAVTIGFWFWCQRPGLAINNVMPSGAIFYARLDHVETHINQMARSDLAKNIAAIDFPEVLARNNFSKKDISDFLSWQKDLRKIRDNPLIRKFLSQEAAVAVFRKDGRYEVFITLRLTASARIAEYLGQLFHQWGDDVILTQQKYQGRVINHVLLKKRGLQFVYVRLRDLLVISPQSFGHLEDVVDVYQHRQSSLGEDPQFIFVRDNAYPSGDAFAFVNMKLISDIWRSEMDSRLETYGYQAAAFSVYGLSYMPGEVSKYKVIAGLDEKRMDPQMRQHLACPAPVNGSLKLAPVNAIAYNWGGCYDLGEYWQSAREKLRENPDWADVILKIKRGLEKRYHINIKRDVLPVLGHQIGGYLTDVDMQGKYPFPRLLVFIKVADLPAAEHLLNELSANPAIELQSEEYNNVTIRYTSLPSQVNMDPGYCLVGDYLLAATSRQLLKASIDAYNDSMRSLISDDTVKQFSLADDGKFHSVTLVKTAELSRRAQDFLGWVDKYLSSQISIAAAAKQDGNYKAQELDKAIADKNDELALAQRKMSQLKLKSSTDLSEEESLFITGAIANLNREEESIRNEIAGYRAQKEELSQDLANYAIGAQSDKLTMFNMENIVSPFLKGLESIDAQAVTVRFDDKILETEILVK